ncbi:hypothetical protein MRB53_012760 [Persea americana]|uniref:Uncharacterized protein n=1 Tax=Persea americana TaxID=3435 RepID=A0ACC2LZ76_PERAE|nr:hypothetical protein MRB53_012760 [Persea americana]
MTNKHQRLWRSIEGDVTTIADKTFPFPHLAGIFSGLLIRKYDASSLCSPIKRHAIIRMIFFHMNLSSLDEDELAKLETHFSLFLLNAMSNSNKEGYKTIDASVELELATVDTYDEEEVAWAFGLPEPASIASIAALPSQVFHDEAFSNSICLEEYYCGVTVTQLPCYDFHRGCTEM